MEESKYLFTFSSYQMFSNEGDGKVVHAPASVTYNELLYGNVIGCLTAVYNAEVLGRQKMPLIRKRQDMGLWLTLLSRCNKAYGLPDILAKYRTDSGMTQNKFNVAKYQWEFYRKVVNLGFFKSSWYFFWYAINGLIKHRV
ncbi:putative teichuronic acid biosynthesis glycosyltransferase TuaG [compost metagenome]